MKLIPDIRIFGRLILLFNLTVCATTYAQTGWKLEVEGQNMLNEYCIGCHNVEDWEGGIALDIIDLKQVSTAAETWEHVIRKLGTDLMPPADQPRPDDVQVNMFLQALSAKIDSANSLNPGFESLHRLNRNEYANVIRDLLDIEIDTMTMLPDDDASEGFDNIADVLNVSPTLIEAYVSAAMKISRLAVGDLRQGTSTKIYRPASGLLQNRHIEGLPLGTRGGFKVKHFFPLDGDYEISIRGGVGGFRQVSTYPAPLIDFTIDGEQVDMKSQKTFKLTLEAGQKELGIALIDQNLSAGVGDTYSVYSVRGGIQSLEIMGPINVTGPGLTPSRERIFICYPELLSQEQACALNILTELASMAYRRPLDKGDREINVLMGFFEAGRADGSFEFGIQQALSRILVDPQFLFRLEREPEELNPGEIYHVSDIELASRLSFFLWSSIPDQELLTIAASGSLSNEVILKKQVARMLADPKSKSLVDNFLGQWLHLRELRSVEPDSNQFDSGLRKAMLLETELLFSNILQEDKSIVELLDADYTYLNERLAQHYGIADVKGSFMRKVELQKNSIRRGILGHGSLLTVTSVANRTSPVVRGNWILENILGVPAPVPPPGVEINLDVDNDVNISSLRQRLEAHRENPVCATCHNIMDPIGLALENFDYIGQWREFDGGQLIDASVVMVDGTILIGPEGVRNELLRRSDVFVATFTEKLLSYALGRIVQYYDMPTVRKIVQQATDTDYKVSSVVSGIVMSDAFRMKVKKDNQSIESYAALD